MVDALRQAIHFDEREALQRWHVHQRLRQALCHLLGEVHILKVELCYHFEANDFAGVSHVLQLAEDGDALGSHSYIFEDVAFDRIDILQKELRDEVKSVELSVSEDKLTRVVVRVAAAGWLAVGYSTWRQQWQDDMLDESILTTLILNGLRQGQWQVVIAIEEDLLNEHVRMTVLEQDFGILIVEIVVAEVEQIKLLAQSHELLADKEAANQVATSAEYLQPTLKGVDLLVEAEEASGAKLISTDVNVGEGGMADDSLT